MAKMTIAQSREREVFHLATFKTENPTAADIAEARRNMNSYYRLCGLAERNLYLANNERTCNRRSTAESEERESKWHKRLDRVFRETYGLHLQYFGYFPSIVDGNNYHKISTYFYE